MMLGFSLLLAKCGRSQDAGLAIEIIPKSFKIVVPFEVNNKGIIFETFWGSDKAKYELLWDNNSPTWVNEKVIRESKSILKIKNISYSTTTANGESIHGDVYNCDSISLKQVTFKNVPFYEISDQMKGVFGENLISRGIWEINFKNKLMVFTSSIDSLEDIKNAELLPSKFANNVITIIITFHNKVRKNVELDFGFNGGILLPTSDFSEVTKGNNRIYKRDLQFSSPGSANILETTNAYDTVLMHKMTLTTFISTNSRVKDKLIGRAFFEKFDFVIFDYKNRLFYISKKKG